MKKLLNIVLFLLVALVFATSVNATYTVDKVEVNGVNMIPTPPTLPPIVKVERGDSVTIRVEFTSDVDAKDVKVKAWLGGYEYGDIEDISDLFDVSANIRNVKNLVLNIPEDMDPTQDYTLYVEVYDKKNDLKKEYTLVIDEQRHRLNFVDIIFNPGLTVKSDQPLFVTVRVENLGEKDEDDVRVIAVIPELGISQRTFIDELRATDPNDASQEDDSESSEAMFLDLTGAKPGNYKAFVRVEYNRGHDYIEKVYPLTITAGKEAVTPLEDLVVDVAEKAKETDAGSAVAYKVSLSNLGTESRKLALEVAGVDAWGTARADPITLTVEQESSKEAFVFVSPNEKESGNKLFSLRVKDGSTIVKEVQLQLNVKGATPLTGATTSNLKSGLEIGFVVLLIILVILGIVLAVNKLKGKEEPEQSYY